MDLATLAWLRSPEGGRLLAEAASGDATPAGRLRELERLRRMAPPERAAAAYELALLRRRAAAKFPHAERMFFTREALEQASGATIAAYRAARYAPFADATADLCCGIGGDTLALAALGAVAAVDSDPLRLAMVAANAEALGLAARVAPLALDLEREPPPPARALFFDPARRSEGRRLFRLAEYRPAVALALGWRARAPAIGIKLAPGVQDDELAPFGPYELELISVDGDLKEALLWLGPLAQPGRSATLLRAGRAPERLALAEGQPMPLAPLAQPGGYLYEPDPAVIRAGLVGPLALAIGAAQVDRSIAYLTGDAPCASPFVRCWRVLEWLPFSLKRLAARLRALDAGPVTVKKRGSALEADALARRLSGGGARALVVALTLVAGRPAALICEGPLG